MRALLAAILACGCVSLVEAGETLWRPAMDYLAVDDDCASATDPETCKWMKESWTRDYEGAISGQYAGQRNVAHCLSTGCEATYGKSIRKNPILGCAWHIVIINSGHLDASSVDASSFKTYCGPHFLDDLGRKMADAQARTILKNLNIPVQLP